jgi:hypothetical protein
MDFRNVVVPVAATPLFQAILNAASLLELEPLKHWGWPTTLPITYVVATGSAAIACLVPANANKTKVILIGSGLVVLIVSFASYTWISRIPPMQGWLSLYEIAAYLTFFATYVAFGFVVARIVRFFAQVPRTGH